MTLRFLISGILAAAVSLTAVAAVAQPIGTFRWQLQPFCNVVTVNVSQQGAVYTMDGFDDQCGAARRAPIVGLGTPNPDGTIGLGWNIVTTPGGRGVQVDARITLPSASGSWSDSAGNAGTLALGASTGGSARPLPSPSTPAAIPGAFSLQTDGGFLAQSTIGIGAIPASGSGVRMMWHGRKGAFRAGRVQGTQWDDPNVGVLSAAWGIDTTASGNFSAAFGVTTVASGYAGTAMGSSTVASGAYATALGFGSNAGGNTSTAMGIYTVASGYGSTATGSYNVASGNYATAFGNMNAASGSGSLVAGTSSTAGGVDAIAMGLRANANGTGSVVLGSDATATTPGVFMYGDRSTSNDLTTNGSNEFLVRAAGGTVFYSNAAMTTGVVLLSGLSGWQPVGVSDENRKTDFRDLDSEQVLGKLATLPVREWRYTTQDAGIRHVGPTAQDFRAAFGLGESDERIGSVDADGIALVAVKALEARTRALRDGDSVINARVAALTRENDDLRARLARLEALLDKR